MSTETIFKPDIKTKLTPPKLWVVLIHNDDFTPMELVVDVLMTVFGKGEEEAKHLMLMVHFEDTGVAGIYPKAIAEQKLKESNDVISKWEKAMSRSYPLKLTIQEE